MAKDKKDLKKYPKGKKTDQQQGVKPPFTPKKDEELDTTTHVGGHNDDNVYLSDLQLATKAAQLSYNQTIGIGLRPVEFPTTSIEKDWSLGNPVSFDVPGVMVHYWLATPGISKADDSAANVSANKLYSFVRHANSGAKNYETADLLIYLMAMDSIITFIQNSKRAYGLAKTFSELNRYTPKALFLAMGLDYEDFKGHLAQMQIDINLMVGKVNSLYVPKNWGYLTRHAWMTDGIYKDDNDMQAQYELFTPAAFWKYSPISSKTGGELKIQPFAQAGTGELNTLTYAEWLQDWDTLSNAIFGDEDIAMFSGDLKKAYGDENKYILSLIGDDFRVEPAYEPDTIEVMHNITPTGWPGGTATGHTWQGGTWSPNIDQLNGFIRFNPLWLSNRRGWGGLFFPLDTSKEDVSTADTARNSRLVDLPRAVIDITATDHADLICRGSDINNKYFVQLYDQLGSDVVCEQQVIQYAYNRTTQARELVVSVFSDGAMWESKSYGATYWGFNANNVTSLFNRRTTKVDFTSDAGTGKVFPSSYKSELQHFALVDVNTIEKLHEAVVLNMLFIK